MSGPRRIDVHHHAIVPKIAALMKESGTRFVLPWSLESTQEVMETHGIDRAMVSNPVPPDLFTDARQASAFTRRANEAVAEMAADHPGRFGLLAALPMPFVDAALDQLRFVYDELAADGVVLVPHAGSHYLGDALFEPLLEELNRLHAVVLVHPMTLPGGPVEAAPPVLADFLLDTTRGAIGLIRSGALERYPHISFVLAHGGGFLPYAADRIEVLGKTFYGIEPAQIQAALRRFHYDTALVGIRALPSLLAVAGPERILFGTDWCAAPAGPVASCARALESLPADVRQLIEYDNALRLFGVPAGTDSVAARTEPTAAE
ncbi:amidohydrolase family protein [Streptomyces sp. NPDC004232]|uniref:amidohydrolase family protein n=1 Tax=Streptomyces sp. NPDC004232 TaxID=3154454 RepID=UPI0033B0A0D1